MHRDSLVLALTALVGLAAAENAYSDTVPDAPDAQVCQLAGGHSNCDFKAQMSGTPTSVVGNRVIVFRKTKMGGHGLSRSLLESAVSRLAERYGFTATISDSPSVFSEANLANTKVVIMSNGEGDVMPEGADRTRLEAFQQVHGWGMLWIHAACSFITKGWPFGQQNCVQQYFHHISSGSQRRIFIDSGTAQAPAQGIRNPQSEFVLRDLPGWNRSRSFALKDEFFCFQAPARNTPGVNVLFGFDLSSGNAAYGCDRNTDTTEAASQGFNLSWTHAMGKGISIVNMIGHDDIYTMGGNMGDSLLWRYIRYAAKDWEVRAPTGFRAQSPNPTRGGVVAGPLSIAFSNPASNLVTITDIRGTRRFRKTFAGAGRAEIPGLGRGIYYVTVASGHRNETKRVQLL